MSNQCPACFTENSDTSKYCIACGTPLALKIPNTEVYSPHHLASGTLLKQNQYKIEKTIGEGGFAITYKAIDLVNNSRYVAIKELWPERAAREGTNVRWPYFITPQERQEQIQKFEDEAQRLQMLGRFNHPSIVKVYEYFAENKTVYIVMQFVEGKTLYSILKKSVIIPEDRIKKYLTQLAYAFKIIHDNNLLHRDIKPENIIIDRQDRAVLVDFGAAREFMAGRSKNMTRILTDGYAPPEQYVSRATRHPSADIYSLCASMYEVLTGQLPAGAQDRVSSTTSNPSGTDSLIPPRQLAPHLSPIMEKIILTGMKIKVEERFKDANHLIEALKGNFISPLLIKGRDLVKQGKLSQAAQVYDQCLAEEPDSSQAAVEKALVLTHLDDPQAETAALQAIQIQPSDGRLYGILGLLNCRKSKWSEALAQLRQAIKLTPHESWIWANLGWALGKCGSWKPAVAAVNKALELDENSSFALGLRAWIAVNQQQWKSAILLAKRSIGNSQQANLKDTSDLQAWVYPCLLVALDQVVSKPSPELERCLQEYVTQVPDSAFGYGFKGWLQASLGDWANALSEFQQAASKPKVPAWILLNLAIAHEHLNNTQAAIQAYQVGAQVTPNNAFILFRLGTVLGREGLWSKASSFLEQAVHLNPDYAEAHHNLGWVLYHIKNQSGLIENYGAVVAAYRQAIALYIQQNKPELAQAIKQAFKDIGYEI